jgi:hypothetical protein
MSEAAFTDSTTAHSSPALTVRPTAGSSRKTMSPSASWAWSVMPMVTLPSASSRAHSWEAAYFRLSGVFMCISSDQGLTVTDEYGFDDARLEALVADFDVDFAADGHAIRQARQGDRLVQAWARSCRWWSRPRPAA